MTAFQALRVSFVVDVRPTTRHRLNQTQVLQILEASAPEPALVQTSTYIRFTTST